MQNIFFFFLHFGVVEDKKYLGIFILNYVTNVRMLAARKNCVSIILIISHRKIFVLIYFKNAILTFQTHSFVCRNIPNYLLEVKFFTIMFN